jgi:hypothetical protein
MRKTTPFFLLKERAAVWGIDLFNKYLTAKPFILDMYHKPLKKLGHLHNKTLNRLQSALLEHDFIIQHKKRLNMMANYLSPLPASEAQSTTDQVAAFDPFQADLYALQMNKKSLQIIQTGMTKNKWPTNFSKTDLDYLKILAQRAKTK